MYKKIKQGLAIASKVILAAPMKLPGKVVEIAKYVALAIGLLEAAEKATKDTEKTDGDES